MRVWVCPEELPRLAFPPPPAFIIFGAPRRLPPVLANGFCGLSAILLLHKGDSGRHGQRLVDGGPRARPAPPPMPSPIRPRKPKMMPPTGSPTWIWTANLTRSAGNFQRLKPPASDVTLMHTLTTSATSRRADRRFGQPRGDTFSTLSIVFPGRMTPTIAHGKSQTS